MPHLDKNQVSWSFFSCLACRPWILQIVMPTSPVTLRLTVTVGPFGPKTTAVGVYLGKKATWQAKNMSAVCTTKENTMPCQQVLRTCFQSTT